MKQGEYIEGTKAQEHFKEGMKTLFKVSKAEVVKAEIARQLGCTRQDYYTAYFLSPNYPAPKPCQNRS